MMNVFDIKTSGVGISQVGTNENGCSLAVNVVQPAQSMAYLTGMPAESGRRRAAQAVATTLCLLCRKHDRAYDLRSTAFTISEVHKGSECSLDE